MTQAQNLANWSQQFADWSNPLANRNYIVDGNFDYWTVENSSVSALAFYGAAMYRATAGAGGAATLNQIVVTPAGEPTGMTSPVRKVLQFNQSTPGTSPFIVQNMEDVSTLQSRSATFSVWLFSTTAITITQIILNQLFGTGGSPSPTASAPKTVNWVLPVNTWKRFSVRLDIPSIYGKTMGTTGNTDSLQVGISLPSGVTFNILMGQWQLEQSSPFSSSDINGNGGAPTPFEFRGLAVEMIRVRRNYTSDRVDGMGTASVAANVGVRVNFPVYMRATPAISLTRTFTTSVQPSSSVTNPTSSGFMSFTVTTSANIGYQWVDTYIADARL